MTQTINPSRLKALRSGQNLSQDDLARRASLNKQTIYRFESEPRTVRPKTLAKLCKALNVNANELTAAGPLSAKSEAANRSADDEKYLLKFRLDGAARNAFSLARLRYNVPLARIVELAPLLFVIVAETSLRRRREKLDRFERALEDAGEIAAEFPHLTMNKYGIMSSESEAVEAEETSIKAKDIFAQLLPGEVCPDYEPNPFFRLLQEMAETVDGDAKVDSASAYFSEYTVCHSEALAVAGGDEKVAQELLAGFILIHEIPRDLMKKGQAEARLAWLRTEVERLEEKRSQLTIEDFEQMIPLLSGTDESEAGL